MCLDIFERFLSHQPADGSKRAPTGYMGRLGIFCHLAIGGISGRSSDCGWAQAGIVFRYLWLGSGSFAIWPLVEYPEDRRIVGGRRCV